MIADINDLMASANSWEVAGYFATALVLLGVIGEYVGELTNLVPSKLWNRRLLVASTLILIVGIGAEILTQVQSNNKNSLIIGVLNKSVEDERKVVEDERTARVTLEAQIAPRRLTPAQQKSFTELLAKFPGRIVHVSTYMRDHEADVLAVQILRATSDAHLRRDDRRMQVDTYGAATIGINVVGADKPLVKATVEAFTSFGLGPISKNANQINYISASEEQAPSSLKIFIGIKPLPVVP